MIPRLDPDRLSIIRECMENYDVGDPSAAEWPNNIISTRAVVYDDGTIARRAEQVSHTIDEGELALCRSLSQDVHEIMQDVPVGMGSQADDGFRAFYVATPADGPAATKIDAALIVGAFRETLFPSATITAEPFERETVWWGEVSDDGEEEGPEYFAPWELMSTWFKGQAHFVDTAFVRIGDSRELQRLPDSSYPEGTEMPGCVLPRLALGLTRKGSLVGLFGHSVQS